MSERGRPTDYSDEWADEFCSLLIDGTSVNSLCKRDDMPDKSSVFLWLSKHPYFSDKYAQAKEMAAEALAEEIFDIADDNAFDYTDGKDKELRVNNDAIQRAKLRVDVRKWYLSKIVPKKYGERIQTDNTTTMTFDLSNLSDEELEAIAGGQISTKT